MLSSLYIHKITIRRFAQSSVSDLGEPVYSSSVVPSGNSPAGVLDGYIPCRIEEFKELMQYRESGKRNISGTVIYTAPEYLLQARDEVLKDGKLYGIITAVNPALKANTTDLDHYEYDIEHP